MIQAWILPLKINVWEEIELCSMTQFTADTVFWHEVKKIISYWCLKTQYHSVSIGLSSCHFSFYEHFNWQFIYAFFYIQDPKMFQQKDFIPILVFYPNQNSFFSENILPGLKLTYKKANKPKSLLHVVLFFFDICFAIFTFLR